VNMSLYNIELAVEEYDEELIDRILFQAKMNREI